MKNKQHENRLEELKMLWESFEKHSYEPKFQEDARQRYLGHYLFSDYTPTLELVNGYLNKEDLK